MNKLTRRMISYCAAVLCTYLIAVVTQTQFVLYQLGQLGVEISPAVRNRAIFSDLQGMAPTYGIALGLVLLLVFVSMSALRHRYQFQGKRLTYWVYPLAAMCGVWLLLLMFNGLFGFHIIAGARSVWGFLAQGLAGFAGGWVYMSLIKLLRRYVRFKQRTRRPKGRRVQTVRR